MEKSVRYSRFAGTWYPDDPEELVSLVDVPHREIPYPARYAVLPHAGYAYSLRGIRKFFEVMDPKIRKIIIISPSHYYPLEPNVILGASFTDAETPIGNVPLFQTKCFHKGGEAEVQAEHGLEMFLPFLAKRGISASLGLISHTTEPYKIAETLAFEVDDTTGVIASSDFTHYGTSFAFAPYGPKVDSRTRGLVAEDDEKVAERLAVCDGRGALRVQKERRSTICGIAGAAILADLANIKGRAGMIADHYDSASVYGGDRSFVDYVSILY